jgi:hypothetical protein
MKKQKKSIFVLGVFMAFIAGIVFIPGLISAGDLEPPAAPASTMKTLDEIPPVWSQKIPGSERFEVVLDGAGVLDKETGLVWEQSPANATYVWTSAIDHCITLESGGRKGWHLPTVEQLASLVDKSNSNPVLPTGHPFDMDCASGGCVQSVYYWSATTSAYSPTSAWNVYFPNGNVTYYDKTTRTYAWCVRGGPGYDAR